MGFHIFPVRAGDKVPHSLAGQWGETATNDPNRVIQFWTQIDPTANIGVACKPSQLLVVDLDRAKVPWQLRGTEWEHLHGVYGQLVQGEDLFDEMCYKLGGDAHRRDTFDTYQVRTGSGGLHLYYEWPAHWPRISQASPVKGLVDVRGNGGQYGGYVLAEGSRTAAGVYDWDGHYQSTGVILPPVWLRRLVAEKPPAPKIRRPQGLRQPGAISHSGLVDTVRNAGEGNRNNSLLWAARTMCEEGVPETECVSVLGEAARDAGLGDFEIERTIQSAYRVQRQKESR
jgi:hypothetical protein